MQSNLNSLFGNYFIQLEDDSSITYAFTYWIASEDFPISLMRSYEEKEIPEPVITDESEIVSPTVIPINPTGPNTTPTTTTTTTTTTPTTTTTTPPKKESLKDWVVILITVLISVFIIGFLQFYQTITSFISNIFENSKTVKTN